MAMAARGLRVDDELRRMRLQLLTTRAAELQVHANALGLPILQAERQRLTGRHLFYPRVNKKQFGKPALIEWVSQFGVAPDRAKRALKAVLVRYLRLQNVFWQVNLGSPEQLCDLFFRALRLPKRTNDGHETVDEEALQSLVALDTSGLVLHALRYGKLATMAEIYERIAPAPDGRIRTVQNPAGTYTFRFSHKEAFYWPHSTNLVNLPNVEAKRDPLYSVRDCIVPDKGRVFLEADLSAADSRSVACLSDDEMLLQMFREGRDVHKFTAAGVLGVEESAVTKTQRDVIGKVTRHAGSFGEGWNSLMRRINGMADLTGLTATPKQAKAWTTNFQRLHPNLDTVWWNRVEQILLAGKPMVAYTGARCNFYPRIDPETGALDAESLRAAVAWEPQYNTSRLAKEALLAMFQGERGSGWRVLLDNHDAVLIDVERARVGAAARALKQAMEREIVVNGHKLTIPSEVFIMRERWSHKERLL